MKTLDMHQNKWLVSLNTLLDKQWIQVLPKILKRRASQLNFRIKNISDQKDTKEQTADTKTNSGGSKRRGQSAESSKDQALNCSKRPDAHIIDSSLRQEGATPRSRHGRGALVCGGRVDGVEETDCSPDAPRGQTNATHSGFMANRVPWGRNYQLRQGTNDVDSSGD